VQTQSITQSKLKIAWALAAVAVFLLPASLAWAATAGPEGPATVDGGLVVTGADVVAQDDEEEDEEEDEPRARRGRGRDEEAETRSATGRKRIIKVVQRKHFMKLHRLEATIPGVGLVTNDPFLRRILFSGKFEFHLTEISSIGAYLCYSPDMGDSDLKQLTSRLEERKEVVPDISRIMFIGIFDVGFSPIFGKVELGTTKIINYDLYVAAGAGVLYTYDDDELVTGGEEKYRKQVHPVTSMAFGFRIAFNEWFGIRLEARLLTHIEQVDRAEGLNLEMKNNFAVQFGPSFFLPPRMKQVR
jgi:outer membrane beta-barrel protein